MGYFVPFRMMSRSLLIHTPESSRLTGEIHAHLLLGATSPTSSGNISGFGFTSQIPNGRDFPRPSSGIVSEQTSKVALRSLPGGNWSVVVSVHFPLCRKKVVCLNKTKMVKFALCPRLIQDKNNSLRAERPTSLRPKV